MLLLGTENLPQGADWSYQIKLDGYRARAIKSGGKMQLRSRNDMMKILAAAILDRVLERDGFIQRDGLSGRTRHLNVEEASPTTIERARISGTHNSE